MIHRAEIIRQKGTNRNQFIQGLVDKYSWVDLGSSYLLNEISSAFLYAQLKSITSSIDYRLCLWNQYKKNLKKYSEKKLFEIQQVPDGCEHNGHLFYYFLLHS